MAGGLITLTPSQFSKTGAARAGGNYASYIKFVNARRSALSKTLAQKPVSPTVNGGNMVDPGLLPLSGGQLAKLAQSMAGPSPRVMSGPELTAAAQAAIGGAINPILDSITSRYRSLGESTQKGIGDLATRLQDRLGSLYPNTVAADQRALQNEAAATSGLSAMLETHGHDQQAAVDQALARIGAPADSYSLVDAQSGGSAHGSAVGAVARGQIGTNLLSEISAGNEDRAAGLPGLAALFGIDSGRRAAASLSNKASAELAAISAQIPGDVLNYESGLRSNESSLLRDWQGNQRQALAGLLDTESKKALARQTFNIDVARNQTTQRGQTLSHQDRQASINAANLRNERTIAAANGRQAARIKAAGGNQQKALTSLARDANKQAYRIAHPTNAAGIYTEPAIKVTYQGLLNQMIDYVTNQMPSISQSQVRQIAMHAVRAAGIYPAAGYGSGGKQNG